MTADELYAMEAETGRTSEWEPLYRAEKARADAAEAEARAFRDGYERAVGDPVARATLAARLDAAEAAVARVRALHVAGVVYGLDDCCVGCHESGPDSAPLDIGDCPTLAALDAP